MGPPEILAIVTVGLIILLRHRIDTLRKDLRNSIDNFRDHFRGGPPGPMHPSPADDGALLRRKHSR